MKLNKLPPAYKKLVQHAVKAKESSYSPYSKFRVGAALLTTNGKIITGANIENSSFSLTICAERTAIFKAISEGMKKFKAIAIATDVSSIVSPCGACRQVIIELAGDIDIIMTNNSGEILVMKASELLPKSFTPEMMKTA